MGVILLQILVVTSVFLPTVSSTPPEEQTSPLPHIQSMMIQSDVYSRYANVKVRSVVLNDAFIGREAMFTVQLPEEAFITEFKMTSGNSTIYGIVKEKKEAQKAYDDAVEKGETAGQVVQVAPPPGRAMKTFSVMMNVAGNSSSVFELTYEELIKRVLGKYTQVIHIEPNQVVPNITLLASFADTKMIEDFAYSLPGSKIFNSDSNAQNGVELHAADKTFQILYNPDVTEQQSHDPQKGIQGNFVIQYDTLHANDGGVVIVNGNAFVHYFSPGGLPLIDKNIVFVIDVSSSMGGLKITQTKTAMIEILGRLRGDDAFNLILFNGKVHPWKKELYPATKRYVSEAKQFMSQYLIASGSTNIDDALKTGIRTLESYMTVEETRGNMIVFLTDGQPTAGETNEDKIVDNIIDVNDGRVSIYCLGFGKGVHFDFLEKLALKNGGKAYRIYAESDAAVQLGEFFASKEDILLKGLSFNYSSDVVRAEDVTKTDYEYYFKGSELVIAGTLIDSLSATSSPFTVQVQAKGRTNEVTYDVSVDQEIDAAPKSYTKRVAAYLKIKNYMDKALVSKGEMKEMYEAKALNMSLEYGFVTKYTSMVVTQSVNKNPNDARDSLYEMDMAMVHSAGIGASMNGFGRKTKYSVNARSNPARDYSSVNGDTDGGFALYPSVNSCICMGLFFIFTALF